MQSLNDINKVADFGPLKQIVVPQGWSEESTYKTGQFHGATAKVFRPPGEPEVGLFLKASGYPNLAAEEWIALKEQKPHMLMLSESEKLQPILEYALNENVFNLVSLKSEIWNGRFVLFLEGRWLEKQWDMLSLFTDMDQQGEQILQIYYGASKLKYPRFLTAAKEAFSSIVWR